MANVERGREARGRGRSVERLEVKSDAFTQGDRIPAKFTGDGEDVSPPLSWADPPPNTDAFALVCEDPDAPSGTFIHWTAWNIDPGAREMPEGARAAGIREGRNGFGDTGYGGPKPPPGKPHRYVFHVYALDGRLDLPAGASRSELDRAMRGHVLAEGAVIGLYGR